MATDLLKPSLAFRLLSDEDGDEIETGDVDLADEEDEEDEEDEGKLPEEKDDDDRGAIEE